MTMTNEMKVIKYDKQNPQKINKQQYQMNNSVALI